MRDWLTKDFYWKAFSLFMAISIWLTVHKESATETGAALPDVARNTYEDVPVLAVSSNTDVHQAKIVPATVTATISGSPEVMNKLQMHAFINLSGINSAVNLSRDVEISLPMGATVVSIDPPTVTVTLPKQP